jgi:hypothetical protein
MPRRNRCGSFPGAVRARSWNGRTRTETWSCTSGSVHLTAEAGVLPDASPPFRWIAVGELNVDDFPAANASVIHKLLASPSD